MEKKSTWSKSLLTYANLLTNIGLYKKAFCTIISQLSHSIYALLRMIYERIIFLVTFSLDSVIIIVFMRLKIWFFNCFTLLVILRGKFYSKKKEREKGVCARVYLFEIVFKTRDQRWAFYRCWSMRSQISLANLKPIRVECILLF